MRAHNRYLLNFLAGGAVILLTSPASAAQAVPRSAPPPANANPAPAPAPSSSTQAIGREMSAPAPAYSAPVNSSPSFSEQQPVRSAPPSSGSSSSGSSSSGSSGSSSSGSSSATSRGGGSTSTSSGSSGSTGTSAVRRGSGTSATSRTNGGSDPIYVGAGSRDRNGRSITGTAVRRSSPIGGGSFFDERWLRTAGYPFSPWGRWYPWYSGGWGYGWVSYDPWRFGGTRWVWGRYGTWWYGATPWYDPWYDPYYGWYGMSYGGGRGGYRGEDENRGNTGSLRLKVNPSEAKVYIDGVLQGVVDDFDGLKSPLDITEGSHQLEIRGDGFVTLKAEIKIEAGKTQTYRGSLKKVK